jgi:hypothetical protein
MLPYMNALDLPYMFHLGGALELTKIRATPYRVDCRF